ncbi:helix-turn-helix domain-containing protein [Streptococcus anginosus]|uniref:helix-turn-helix domain-containing protein n=1 Tax=Streptococcus anginosus TaxID=1328 RepID=UPI001786FC6D|nr:helix-turn-helix transcriptional regulator [Streptococcus anginosus]
MAHRLKELRKKEGLIQEQVANILGTNQSQYGKYENGKTNLSLENAKILADYFGVSIPYLLGIDDTSTLIDPFQKFPNRIGELIDASNKTLKEISRETNINYETLSAYKRQVRHPKKENALKLANYFNVSVAYLLGLEGEGQRWSYETSETNLTEQMDVPLFNPYLELMKKTIAILVDENGEYEELARFYGWSETEFEGKKAYKLNEKKDKE